MLNIYKASAGSGKTYKLAYEYILMVLGVKRERPVVRDGKERHYRLNMAKYGQVVPNLHRQILAITFTNKATEEMKRRIIENLYDLSCMPDPRYADADYAEALMDEFGCSRQDLADVALWTMRRMLYDYQFFSVSTIDSFFQKVLRSFARELNQQGDFELELDDHSVMQIAVGNMLDDFNSGRQRSPELYRWILDYMNDELQEGRKNNFFNRTSNAHYQLVKNVASINSEEFKAYWEPMRAYLTDPDRPLDKFSKSLYQLRERSKADFKTRTQRIIDEVGAPIEKSYVCFRDVLKAMLQSQKCPAKRLTEDKFKAFLNGDTDAIGKLSDVSLTDRQIRDLRQLLQDAYFIYHSLHKVIASLHTLRLLSFAWPYFEGYAGENNLVMLSSTNALLRRVIGNDDAPFIYERVGVQLQNFLIDEFQDTSRLQWENLKSLVENGLSQNADSLIIGDVKQSIYRFRNSDPSLLDKEVEQAFPDLHRVFGNKVSENTNYRSSRDVVTFNNTLFSMLPYSEPDEPIPGYEGVVQAVNKQSLRGYVRFEPYALFGDKGLVRDQMFQDLCHNIIREHEGGCAWRDIAILVNRNDDGAAAIEYIMRCFPDIPLTSGEALLLKKSSAVQLVIAMLRIIDQLQSTSTPIVTSQKLYPTASEVVLMLSRYEYFIGQGIEPSNALYYAIYPDQARDGDVPKALDAGVDAIIERSPSSLLSMVETIISQHLSPEQRKAQLAYLLALQDTVAEYSQHFTPTVHAFLQWWDKTDNISIKGAQATDAVNVMTIHKSKGLEFKCVHIPYASWAVLKTTENKQWVATPHFEGIPTDVLPPALYIDPANVSDSSYFAEIALAERQMSRADVMNKTYVAYTRAINELIVYYDPDKDFGKLLVEAFNRGLPNNDGSAPSEWLIDLSPFYDAESKRFEMGKQYQLLSEQERGLGNSDKKPHRPAPGSERQTMDIEYDAVLRDDAQVFTTLDSALRQNPDIDDMDEAPRYDADDFADEASRIRGNQLHEILSGITVPDDLPKAWTTVVTQYALTDNVARDLKRIIEAALAQDDERVVRWFGPDVRVSNEQTIYLPTVNKQRRLDRLVVYPDGSADIVDYKFTTRVRAEHHRQLQRYVALVNQMRIFTCVRGYLWYPEQQKIVNVEPK